MSAVNRFVAAAGLLAANLVLATPARAQLTISFNFLDGTGGNPAVGFADPTFGATRQATLGSVALFVQTQLDGRGNATITVNPSSTTVGSLGLASAGSLFQLSPGTFRNGRMFERLTTNPGASVVAGAATYNFASDIPWNSGTGAPGAGQFDLFSVSLHEITHALGYSSLMNANGQGLSGSPVGSPDTYSQFGRLLVRGNPAIRTLLASNAAFNTAGGASPADLVSNDVFLDGPITRAANGGNPARVFAPSPFQTGSSLSHLDPAAHPSSVMQPAISQGESRRAFTAIDLANLIDMGWNTYIWTNATGSWADNVASTASSRWRNADGQNSLSPVGSITPNMVLQFNGSGGVAYTSTNNLPAAPFQVMRMTLNSTATVANTIAGNKIQFGTSIGVQPQIQQSGTGAFNLNTPIDLTAPGLELTGNGTGIVTIGGTIGTAVAGGGLTKSGTSTFVMTGSNTYSGGTTVSAGTLRTNNSAGSVTGSGAVSVANGATLGGNHTGSGNIGGSVAIGGNVAPGAAAATDSGRLDMANGLSFSSTGRYLWTLSTQVDNVGGTAGIQFDQIRLTGGNLAIDPLAGLTLDFAAGASPDAGQAFWQSAHVWTVLSLAGGANPGLSNFALMPTNAALFASVGSFNLTSTVVGIGLSFVPVPEPTWMLFTALVGGGFWQARRKYRAGRPAAASEG